MPNECQPDSRSAKFTSGTPYGVSPTTTAPFGAAGTGTEVNAPGTFSLAQWPIQSIIFGSMIILIMLAVILFVYFRAMH